MKFFRSSPEPATRSERKAERRLRFRFPRFGLRSLFILALIFCLLFGWIGRGVYRVRQEDAAMESLLQAGATIWLIHDSLNHPQWMGDQNSVAFDRRMNDRLARVVGWSKSPRIYSLGLDVPHPDDVAADHALAALAFFPDVEELSLTGEAFDDASLQELKRLPRLRSLALTRTRITADGLAALPAPERIRTLSHEALPGQRNLLVGVAPMKNLRSLTIGRSRPSREAMDAVAALPKLEALTLTIFRPDGEDLLLTLTRSKSLRELYLSLNEWAPLNPPDYAALRIPPNVERVSIDGLRSSELPRVIPGSGLRILMLRGWSTDEDVACAFSAEHPACQVQLWSADCGADHIFLAGRRIGPGTSEPLAQAAGPLTTHER